MAKYGEVEEQFAGGEYVKLDALFAAGTVFNVVDAQVVDTPFRDKLTNEQQEGVEFTIQYADAGESEGIAQKKFTMGHNSIRQKFVDFFNDPANGGEKLEDMEICKLASTGKGNPPWGFKASAREAFPAQAPAKNGRK